MANEKNRQVEKSEYLARLKRAIEWGLGEERPAWGRALAAVMEEGKGYSVEALREAKRQIMAAADDFLDAWFAPIYDNAADRSALFDVEAPPEEIWQQMICLNTGIFDQRYGDVLLPLLITIPSSIPNRGPLYLSPTLDGWGVKP